MQGYKTLVQILNTAVGGKSTFFGTSSASKNLSLQQLKLALFLEIEIQVLATTGLLSPLCKVFGVFILDLDYGGFITPATVLQCRTGSGIHILP